MKNENVKTIQCPYCGTINEFENRMCLKCGNRIPQSVRMGALAESDRPVGGIVIKNETRKTLMPLRRTNGEPKPRETREEKDVPKQEEFEEKTIDAIKPEPVALRTPLNERDLHEDKRDDFAEIDEASDVSEVVSIRSLEKTDPSIFEIESIEDYKKDDFSKKANDQDLEYSPDHNMLEENSEIDVPEAEVNTGEYDDRDFDYDFTEREPEYVPYEYDATSEETEDEYVETVRERQEETNTLDDGLDYASYREEDLYSDDDNIPREYVDDVTIMLSDTIENVKEEIASRDEFTSDFELNPNWDEKADKINIPLYIVRATLKPFNKFKKEEEKLGDLRNVIFLAIVLIVTMTIFGVFKTMLETARITSFWTGETTWVLENLKDIEYFDVIITNLVTYTGVIIGLTSIYYGASYALRKEVKFVKLLSATITAFIPCVLTYGLLSTILSLVYEPLVIIVTVIGIVYSVIILIELINDIVPIEDVNSRIYFHMVCLVLFFTTIVVIGYEAGFTIVKEELGFLSNSL